MLCLQALHHLAALDLLPFLYLLYLHPGDRFPERYAVHGGCSTNVFQGIEDVFQNEIQVQGNVVK